MQQLVIWYNLFLSKLKYIDWLGPLALRLYLAPIFIGVGLHKFANWDDMVGLVWQFRLGTGSASSCFNGCCLQPVPELLGGLALLAGLATRLVVLPLMVTMLVAAGTAHWDNGWFAIASGGPPHQHRQSIGHGWRARGGAEPRK